MTKRTLTNVGSVVSSIGWLAGAILLCSFLFGGFSDTSSLPQLLPVENSSPASLRSESAKFVAIENIRVGQRVVADDPDFDITETTNVDPATWRLLTLRCETTWADVENDVIEVSVLKDPEWIKAYGAIVGARVPISIDTEDMGLMDGLLGTVIANEECPPIASGPGRVVLATMNHFNASVWELGLTDSQGRTETIRPTGLHRFYSADQKRRVRTVEMTEGDNLQSTNGNLIVSRLARVPGIHRVYNLTVEGEHVYYVSQLAALTHNNGCGGGAPNTGAFPNTADEMTDTLGSPPKKVGTTPDGTRRTTWEPNANTRIRHESHPEGLKPGDPGYNPRHHGEHFHVETKPDGMSWSKANKTGNVKKAERDGYTPGSGTGYLPGEIFPGG